MGAFGKLSSKFQQMDIISMLKVIAKDTEIQEFIKNAPKNRIQNTGIDADGNELRTDRAEAEEVYNSFTIDLKEEGSGISAITSHVTLTQGGEFWESLKLIVKSAGIDIESDFVKTDGHMYRNFRFSYNSRKEYEDAVNGLNEIELDQLAFIMFRKLEKKMDAILQK